MTLNVLYFFWPIIIPWKKDSQKINGVISKTIVIYDSCRWLNKIWLFNFNINIKIATNNNPKNRPIQQALWNKLFESCSSFEAKNILALVRPKLPKFKASIGRVVTKTKIPLFSGPKYLLINIADTIVSPPLIIRLIVVVPMLFKIFFILF